LTNTPFSCAEAPEAIEAGVESKLVMASTPTTAVTPMVRERVTEIPAVLVTVRVSTADGIVVRFPELNGTPETTGVPFIEPVPPVNIAVSVVALPVVTEEAREVKLVILGGATTEMTTEVVAVTKIPSVFVTVRVKVLSALSTPEG
jgi:hypothetical protein